MAVAFGAFAVVEGLGGGVAQGGEGGQEHGVLSRWLPRRERVSPARVVPDWRVTGARPASAASLLPLVKADACMVGAYAFGAALERFGECRD